MYLNKRKTQNIQKSNLILEQRYLKEQAPPPPAPAAAPAPAASAPAAPAPAAPAPAGSPTTPSSSSTRTPIKPMVKASGPKSIKDKNGKVTEWEAQDEQQKLSVAKKCGYTSVKEYQDQEWKCEVQEVK